MRTMVLSVAAVGLAVPVVVAAGSNPPAFAAAPFTAVYSANLNGELRVAGATLETCVPSGTICPSALTFAAPAPAANNNNNNQNMTYLNQDPAAGLLDSSALNVTIPAGSTVTFAGLYWQAFGPDAAKVAAHPGNKFKLKTPGAASYQTITAASGTYNGYHTDATGVFAGFADITSLVQAAGTGTKTWYGGDIPELVGTNDYGGWSIVYVYSAPSLPMRNINVYDGLAIQSTSGTNTISISGFLTPPPAAGTVKAEVVMVAGEGDFGTTGDALLFNSKNVSDVLNPANNVFNSQFTDDGVSMPPAIGTQTNALGFDAKRLNVDGFLTNSQTSTTLVTSSSGDAYYPQGIGTQIDIFTPVFPVETKTVVDVNGNNPAKPGDVLRYTLNIQNIGKDPALLTSVTDTVPTGTAYVPNSIIYTVGANTGPKTDAAGDDQAKVVGSTITLNIGASATSVVGGTLDPAIPATTLQTITFDVTVLPSALGTTISNIYRLDYTAQTLNQKLTYFSNPATYPVVAATADLVIAKTANVATVVPGSTYTYTVTVTNNGPYDAQNVVVSDAIPVGLTLVSAVPSQGTCAASTCTLGTAANGATYSVVYTVTASPSLVAGSLLANTATVQSSTPDPHPGNETVTVTNPVGASADVVITKTLVGGPTFVAGSTVSWTETVVNNGPSAAAAVTVNDPLPAGLSFVSAAATAGTCSGTTTVSCLVGTLAAGSTATITIVTATDPNLPAGSTITNSAAVTSTTNDPNPANNTSPATGTATVNADVSLVKTANTNPIIPGQPATWTVKVTNNGPSTATAVAVTDNAPAGVTWTSVSATSGTCTTAAASVCTIATIASGATVTLTYTGSVLSSLPDGSLVANTATETASTPDPTPGNNSSATSTPVKASVAIAVSKTGTPTPVTAGTPLSYTVTFTNNGPSDTTNATIVDPIPAGTSFHGVPTSTQGTCSIAGQTMTCALGTVVAGRTVTVTIPVDVASTVTAASISNTATGSSSQAAPVAATVSTPVGRQADLALTKTGPAVPVVAGATGVWTFTVTNNGPSLADNYTVTDVFPAGQSAIAYSDPACTGSATMTCTFGAIALGASKTFTVTVAIPAAAAAGAVTNTASVSSTSPSDPAASNNSSTASMTVARSADISVTKSASGIVTPGAGYMWTIVAANAGPSTATAATVTDVLPTGFTFQTSGSNPACSAAGQTVTCALGSLAPAASVSLTVAVIAASSLAPGSVSNTATVSTTTPDPAPANDTSTVTSPVAAKADLVTVKTAPPTVTPGLPATWTVTVSNAGPSDAATIVVDDTAPTGVAWTAVTANSPLMTCTLAGHCILGSLAAGGSVTITLTGAVNPTLLASSLANTATASTTTPDPNPANNSATVVAPVVTAADLAVNKTATAATFIAGTTAAWTVTVTNNGPSTARAVTVADALPSGFTIFTVTASTGTCVLTSCSLGDIAAGSTVTIGVTGVVPASVAVGSVVTNSATVSSATPDPTSGNNTASAVFTALTSADVAITKANTSTSITAGGSTTWQLTIVNNGPSDATAVAVNDPLPSGFTATAVTAPFGACSTGTTVSCTLGTLAAGQAVTIVVNASAAASLAGGTTAVNTATLTSTTPDPTPANNTSTASTPVVRSADLVVVKTYIGPALTAGASTPSWRIDVTNTGPSDAANVNVSDTPAATLSAVSAVPAQGTCVTTIACALGTIAAGSTISVTVSAALASTHAGPLSNTAAATTTDPDPNAANNTSTVSTPVATAADLSIAKTANATFVAGADATYTLTATNNGPSVAQSTVVADTLPAGLTFVSAAGAGAACTASGSALTCNLAAVASGAAVTVTVTVHVSNSFSGSLANTATVSSATLDPSPANNTATAVTAVSAQADLSVTKSSSSTFVAGLPASYTITVTDNGPSDATAVNVTDQPPTGYTVTSATSTLGTCDVTVTCDLGTIPIGSTVTITVAGIVDPDFVGALTNSATATSAVPDPVPTNNTATLASAVATVADLAIVKTADTNPITPGALAQWTLAVTNNGPSTARSVTVADPAPAGVTWTFATSTVGTCAVGASAGCSIGDLPAGASAIVTVQGNVASNVTNGSTMTNTATAASTTGDPTPGNNSASTATPVKASVAIAVTKTATPDPIIAGSQLVYRLTLHNVGPSDTTGAVLVDTLPSGLTFAGPQTASQGLCTVAGPNLSCAIGTVTVGQTVSVLVPVNVDPSVAATAVVNTASGSSDQAPVTPATFTSTVTAQADLQFVKTGPASPVSAGTTGTFTFAVTNAGPSTAQTVTVVDPLPAGMSATAFSDPACSGTTTVSCLFATIANGSTRTFTVTVFVDPAFVAGPGANTASVSAVTPSDPTQSNNTSTGVMDVVRSADISSVKTGAATFTPGLPYVWTVSAANAGPSTATSSVVTDLLPAGFTFDPTTSDLRCSAAGALVTCDLGVIAPAASTSVAIGTDTDPALPAAAVSTNTANLTSTTPDPNPSNNAATAATTAVASADVTIVKTAPAAVVPGAPATWTIDITNHGPSDAQIVTVDDLAPAGVTWTSVIASDPAATCDLTAHCAVATLPFGATLHVILTGDTVASMVGGILTNTATVAAATPDPDTLGNSSTAPAPITPQADLAVTKAATSSTVTAGQLGTWIVTVTNTGPSAAANVTVDDTLGFPVDSSSATATSGACVALLCTIPAIAAGDTVTITVTTAIPAATPDGTTLTNAATVASDTTDPNAANDTAAASMAATATADIALVKLNPATTITAGTSTTWTLTATNNGPSDAQAVAFADPLPAGVTATAATLPGGTCTIGSTVTCTLGVLPAGTAATATIVADVASTVTAGSTVTNTATVTSGTADPNAGDNTSTATTPVVRSAGIRAIKTYIGPTLTAGGTTAAWRIDVTNTGPSEATAVTLGDTPAATLTGITTSTTQGTCTTAITCAFGTVAAGSTVSVTVTGQVAANHAGTLDNTATASAAEPDPNPADNTSTVSTAVATSADLSITKTPVGTFIPGTDASYTLVVLNNGPSDAQAVTISDTLPTGFTFVAATGSAATCTAAAGTVSCDLATVAAGTAATVTVTGHVTAGYLPATLDNTATVASATADPNTTNNASTGSASVSPSADLSISKVGHGPYTAGTPASYTIVVTNNGPSDAQAVTVNDPPPAGFTPTAATSTIGTCDLSVTCVVGVVAAGATVTVIVTGDIAADYTSASITNTAAVASATPDPNPAGNTAAAVEGVASSADLSIAKSANGVFTAGQSASWTVTVTNHGPSDAANVTVADILPSGFAVIAANLPAGCSIAGQTVTCTQAILANGALAVFTINGTVDSGFTPAATLSNTAGVSAATPDPTTADNNATTLSPPVATAADLVVTKTANGPFVAGQPATWTVNVTNAGPSTARNVAVNDPSPTGTISSTLMLVTTVGTCAGAACTIGDLPSGSTAIVTVTVTVDPSATAAVSNTVTASSSTPDPSSVSNTATTNTPVATSADLAVTKTLDTPLTAGQPGTYTITVTNNGPSDALNATVSDTPDAAYTVTSAATSHGGCDTTVACTLGTVAAGSSVSVHVAGNVAASYTAATLANTAAATSSTPDPLGANDSVTVNSPVGTSADLAVTKTADGPFVAGQPGSWTITVVNHGSSDAQQVAVSDIVPQGFIVAAGSLPPACSVAGQTVSCTQAVLANGATTTFTISGTVASDYTPAAAQSNTATVTSATSDPAVSDNTATASSGPVATSADLTITKTANGPFTAGQAASWTLTVTNLGPSTARSVSVSDPAPAGVDPATLTLASTAGTCSGPSCALGDIAANATVTVTVSAAVDASTTAPVSNSATVGSATSDPDPASNTASTTTPVTTAAHLVTVKSASVPFVAGQPGTWTITVTNLGPSDAQATTVTDHPPAGYAVVTVGSTQGSCDLAVVCAVGTIAAGSTVTVTVTGDVAASYTAASMTNVAEAASPTVNPVPTDATGAATAPIVLAANLAMFKTANGPFIAGASASFTLTATNQGPSDAQGPVITDVLPAAFTVTASTLPPGCTVAQQTVTCSQTVLAPGLSMSFTIAGIVDPSAVSTSMPNTASVASSTPDANLVDNSATAVPQVASTADVSLIKTLDTLQPIAGQPVQWTLTAHDIGPSDAQQVAIADPLPLGVTFGAATAQRGSCAVTAGVLNCDLGTLTVGQSVTVILTGTIDASFLGTSLANTAEVSSATPDPTPANNIAFVAGPTATLAGLAISKVADTASFTPGTGASWTITVVNSGPSDAQTVVVTDSVNPSVSAVTATSTAGTCAVGAVVSCTIPTLAAGASVTVSIAGVLDSAYVATALTNSANAIASTFDPAIGDNTATSGTPVVPAADLSVVKTAGPPATAGVADGGTYVIAVTNAGPSDAQNVTIVDALPVGFTASSAIGATAVCDLSVSCSIPFIPAGQTATVTITGTVAPDVTALALLNTATASSVTLDPNPGNETGVANLPVVTSANLAVAKTIDTTPVAGLAVAWTITVTNNGPSDAQAVTINDSAPAGIDVAGFTLASTQATCSVSSCTVGIIPAGGVVVVHATGVIDPAYTGATIANTATATTSTPDPNPAGSAATVSAPLTTSADLSLSKTATTSGVVPPNAAVAVPFVAGGVGVWTVMVTNNGPSVARGVTITDPAPVGFTITTATTTGGTCVVGPTLTCTVGDILPGAATQVTITGVIDPAYPTTSMTNTATAASTTADPNADNSAATASTAVATQADIVVLKSTPAATATPGTPASWNISVTNRGPSDARDVVVTDINPTGSTATTATAPCVVATNGVTCPLGTVAAGQTILLTVTGLLAADLQAGTVANTATATSSTPFTNPSTATSTATLAAVPVSDLVVTKTGDGIAHRNGDTMTWTVIVVNNGPSTAYNTVTVDNTPSGFNPVSVSPSLASTCTIVAHLVTCRSGRLDVGQTLAVTITGTLSASGTITNTATATTDFPAPVPTHGTGSASSAVGPTSKLVVKKSADAPTAIDGGFASWTITALNDSNDAAVNVVVAEHPGNGLQITAATATSGTFDLATATWTIPTLPPGSTATLHVTTKLVASGHLVNAVSATSATDDPATPATSAAGIDVAARPVPPLPNTGIDIVPMLQTAGALILLGGGILLISSRRRRSRLVDGRS
jgi:uncharacterized repeat protein (TIGR01451 family)/LPXTG-motif cell wall-anchored protein